MNKSQRAIGIVGGCGRVGLPLAVALAQAGHSVVTVDRDLGRVTAAARGRMPFKEPGVEPLLRAALDAGSLRVTNDPAALRSCEVVVVVVGTDVDSYGNPSTGDLLGVVRSLHQHLTRADLVVLRSTVYPGVTERVARELRANGCDADVAYCPERVAEGAVMRELATLPQIVSGTSERAVRSAAALFGSITDLVVELTTAEAEVGKLISNAWRYITFAVANEFHMTLAQHGIDYEHVRGRIAAGYPRLDGLPAAGPAGGPCLPKDTRQLIAFSDNYAPLAQSAFAVNESVVLRLVSRLRSQYPLAEMAVGILGMAFKAGSDDVRGSLSSKLRDHLALHAATVLCTDPYAEVPGLSDLADVMERADLLILAVPHAQYVELPWDPRFVDPWSINTQGVPDVMVKEQM